MDLPSVLLAGLGAGLLGSIVGLAGTWAIDWHRADVTMRGNARALYFELVRNAVFLHGMAGGEIPIVEISDTVWRQTMVSVASFLNPHDLKIVSQSYAFLDFDQERIRRARNIHQSDNEDRQSWARTAGNFDIAAGVVRSRAWSDRELRELAIPIK